MAETKSERSETTKRRGNETTIERHEVTTIKDNTPRKAFKLRPGMRHMQDGQMVQAGDEVMLTRDQARAFADKFVPVDEDADFEEGEYQTYRSGQQQGQHEGMDEREYGEGEEERADQGHPVPTPVITVGGAGGVGPQGALKDPTALDPAKQGQQTNEQRRIIDSGNAPPPKLPTQVPSLEEQRAQAAGREPGSTSSASERNQATGSSRRESGSGGRQSSEKKSASDGPQQ